MIDDGDFDALLVAARAGDEAALAVLFRALHPRLLRFLRAREPAAADDLAGEVWMAVATGLNRFEGDAGFWRGCSRSPAANCRSGRRGLRRNTHPVANENLERTPAVDDPGAVVGRCRRNSR